MECPDCEGAGRIEYEETVGGSSLHSTWQSYRSIWLECERCRGRKEIDCEDD